MFSSALDIHPLLVVPFVNVPSLLKLVLKDEKA